MRSKATGTTRVIPLGGLGEIGKNMTVVESGGSLVVIDAGLSFPRDEHLGVDLVLPDFGYLREHERDILAVLLTHGHEDHVGALPYLMREVRIPQVWGTKLTLGLVKSKLDEHGLGRETELVEMSPDGSTTELGPFGLRFVRMAHSIPDAVAIVLDTPGGRIVHTGDYKIDHTPIDGFRTDVGMLAKLGNEGVDLLLGDSTNAERPGVTLSERTVGEVFRQIIGTRRGRILIASFASNVHRFQQAIDVALETHRRVAIVGRSLRKNVNIARNLGYVDVRDDLLLRPQDLADLRPQETMILCTGSQGEPMSALTRIAYGDHPHVEVEPGDTVIISAKPVPGNELRVHDTINRLARLGAEILHQEIAPVHVSGHGHSEEIRMVLALLRPRNVMPVHGEFRMLAAQARLAREAGVPDDRIVLADNGAVVELSGGSARVVDHIETGVTFVDGLTIGDERDMALHDRRRLSEEGIVLVVLTLASDNGHRLAPTVVVARGLGDADFLLAEAKEEVEQTLNRCLDEQMLERKLLEERIHDAVGKLIVERTGRRPLILPVVLEV